MVTEEVLLTSGEQARLLGRLITNQAISASDHGFYLSEDENFTSPIIISLGPKEGPGRFIGEVSGLSIDRTYFVRAFMDIGSGVEFGNTIEMATLAPGLQSFEPTFGKEGAEVFIFGRNFTQDTRVFFGDQEAPVTEILFETRLKVIIPSATTSNTVDVRVVVQDAELVFDNPFEYQIGTYVSLGTYPDQVRLYDNVYFQRGNDFYIGLGSDRLNAFFPNLSRFNVSTGEWIDEPFVGTNRSLGFATANYVGGGIRELTREPFLYNRNFYRFTGGTYVQLGDMPFDSNESVAFEIGGDLFVIGNKEGDPQIGWQYRPGAGAWSQIATAPFPIDQSIGNFTFEGEQYFISPEGIIVKYNPVFDVWDEVGFFPGNTGQGYPIAQVVGDKVYVGAYRRSKEMWEWNTANGQWTAKNDIPGITQNINVGAWVRDGLIYFLRTQESTIAGNGSMTMYEFDPNGL